MRVSEESFLFYTSSSRAPTNEMRSRYFGEVGAKEAFQFQDSGPDLELARSLQHGEPLPSALCSDEPRDSGGHSAATRAPVEWNVGVLHEPQAT